MEDGVEVGVKDCVGVENMLCCVGCPAAVRPVPRPRARDLIPGIPPTRPTRARESGKLASACRSRLGVTHRARSYSEVWLHTMSICRIRPHVSRLAALLCPALVAIAGAGCQNTTSDRDLVYRTPTEAIGLASSNTGVLGAGGLPKVLWLDPRTPKEFEEGHIPQAVNIPFPEIERTHEVSCKGFEMFIVYDTDYDDVMAKASAKRLIELGYRKVYCIVGGLKAWKADGNPVATGK